MEQREKLRVRFRGIQQACVEFLLAEINRLALHYRENKPTIDELRRQLAVVRRPIGTYSLMPRRIGAGAWLKKRKATG
jgi:hypothetical protein